MDAALSPTKLLIQQQDLDNVDIVELEDVHLFVSMDVVVYLMDVIVTLNLLVMLLLDVMLFLHLEDVDRELDLHLLLIVELIRVPLTNM